MIYIETNAVTKSNHFFVSNPVLVKNRRMQPFMHMQNRIKYIRENILKITQEQLAEIFCINRVSVTRYETGKRTLEMKQAVEYSEKLEKAGYCITPIEFFVGPENDKEQELLKTFRGLSDKEQSLYLSMGNTFLKEKGAPKKPDINKERKSS